MWSSFDPYQATLTAQASVFVCYAYHRESGEKWLLPNITCEGIDKPEGARPATAQFRYIFDTTGRSRTAGWPQTVGEVWRQTPDNDYVMLDEEEILVYEVAPDNSATLMFHGTVKLPEVGQSQDERASFTAVSIAAKLWNNVIEGSYYRDANDIEAGDWAFTVHDAWFNPKGKPNKTPDDFDVDAGQPNARPLFLDERLTDEERPQDFWDLGGFVRYLAWHYNPDEEYVKNPIAVNGQDLDTFLQAITPKNDGDYFDLADPSTFDRNKILIRSLNVANKSWIEAIEQQLNYHGFYLFFVTTETDDGTPETKIVIFRKDGLDGARPVAIEMADYGGSLLDGIPDANAFELSRDRTNPVNEWIIQTAPVFYEVAFILCPLFPIAASDATDTFIKTITKSQLANATAEKRRLYRHFGIDECGQGHWTGVGAAKDSNLFNFDELFGERLPAADGEDEGPLQWAVRFRPGINTLCSKDNAGVFRKAELAISTDYAGAFPAIWDRSGTWRSLADSSWNLLKDRLGVEIITDNPDRWTIPTGEGSGAKGDIVRAVKCLAAPDADNKRFHLRLTVVIQSDHGLGAVARRRQASPLKDTVRRSIDGKDHFQKQLIHKSSPHNTSGDYKIARDDTKEAKAKVEALRGTHEFPAAVGMFSIPWISHAYGVGDLVSHINGRDLSFATNAGTGSGESPYLPTITGITYRTVEPQATIFRLSDRRASSEGA